MTSTVFQISSSPYVCSTTPLTGGCRKLRTVVAVIDGNRRSKATLEFHPFATENFFAPGERQTASQFTLIFVPIFTRGSMLNDLNFKRKPHGNFRIIEQNIVKRRFYRYISIICFFLITMQILLDHDLKLFSMVYC